MTHVPRVRRPTLERRKVLDTLCFAYYGWRGDLSVRGDAARSALSQVILALGFTPIEAMDRISRIEVAFGAPAEAPETPYWGA